MASEPTDERLMQRYQAGDVGAFEVLLRRHRGSVQAFLFRFCGDAARAEELGQETWLKIVAAAPRWERRARWKSWALAIARNVALDDARRSEHRAAESLDAPRADGVPLLDAVPSQTPGPDRGADDALLRPLLTAALLALPVEQREVFVLREYAGVPFAEIAAITGAPVPTVKSRMRYALEGLRAALARAGVLPDQAAGPRSAVP